MDVEQLYAMIEGDYQDALGKYKTDDKIARYLGILVKSDSINQLAQAMAEGNAEAGFMAAHSLKGTTSNMSLGRMADLFDQLTEKMRAGVIDQEAQDWFVEAKRLYDSMVEQLSA